MSWCSSWRSCRSVAPSPQTPKQAVLAARTYSPDILKGQDNPNIFTVIVRQAQSADSKKGEGKEKIFETECP